MRSNIVLNWVLATIFAMLSIGYTIWSLADLGRVEWAGTIVLALSAVFSGFLAFYLGLVRRSIPGELPEDRETADIDDGDPEIGDFMPSSWWPIVLAGAIALVFLGLAVGTWITLVGLPILVIALVGWVYEAYRGNFSR